MAEPSTFLRPEAEIHELASRQRSQTGSPKQLDLSPKNEDIEKIADEVGGETIDGGWKAWL